MNFTALLPSLTTKIISPITVSRCSIKRWVAPVLHEMYLRRRQLGPQAPKPRSSWLWNVNAELYAFGKRLNEPLNFQLLRKVFTHQSYIDKEEKSRKDMGLADVPLNLESNESLQQKGKQITDDYIKCYLRLFFPRFPEEGIEGVKKYLTTDEQMAYVSRNIGTVDLALCEVFAELNFNS
ncbi:hypothetical protein CHUAL_005918 [Chamberlinius hualienensis]